MKNLLHLITAASTWKSDHRRWSSRSNESYGKQQSNWIERNRCRVAHGGYCLAMQLRMLQDAQTVPQDWQDGVIVKLSKKGNLMGCNNWHSITLCNSIVLLRRLRCAVDSTLQKEQAGFRSNRSCTQKILSLGQCVEYRRQLKLNFRDFKKAVAASCDFQKPLCKFPKLRQNGFGQIQLFLRYHWGVTKMRSASAELYDSNWFCV